MLVRYVGLARNLAGIEEEIITEKSENVDELIGKLCEKHDGDLADAFAAKGFTPLGQLMIEIGGRAIDLKNAKDIKLNPSSEISFLIIPTVVGG